PSCGITFRGYCSPVAVRDVLAQNCSRCIGTNPISRGSAHLLGCLVSASVSPLAGARTGHRQFSGPDVNILLWIVFGLIAGVLAKWIMPGRDPGGIIITIALGIVGAFIGGFIGSLLGLGDVTGFDIRSFFLAVLGVVLLLAGYRFLKART